MKAEVEKTQVNILKIEKTLFKQKKEVLLKRIEKRKKIEIGMTNPIAKLRLLIKEETEPKLAVEGY